MNKKKVLKILRENQRNMVLLQKELDSLPDDIKKLTDGKINCKVRIEYDWQTTEI